MKKILFVLFITHGFQVSFGQKNAEIFTTDIDHFWRTYDSIQQTADTVKQLHFIQSLYLDYASDGLKAFMKLRGHTAKRHLNNIHAYPKFWKSIRQNTEAIKSHTAEIERIIAHFKKIYPRFKPVKIYFTIGVFNSGGTASKGKVLIGAEIACADKETDASELNQWLQNVFRTQGDLTALVAHELGHTQQKTGTAESLLGQSIKEGACDFLAELMGKPISSPYMTYGKANEKYLWDAFKKDMNGRDFSKWLYNGLNAPNAVADLGYFIGYKICQSYYKNTLNKKRAIRKIIQLKYDHKSVIKFLIKSQYNDAPKQL